MELWRAKESLHDGSWKKMAMRSVKGMKTNEEFVFEMDSEREDQNGHEDGDWEWSPQRRRTEGARDIEDALQYEGPPETRPLLTGRAAAYSAPEQRWTVMPKIEADTPRSFLDSFRMFPRGIKDFREDLEEVREGFRSILFPNDDSDGMPAPRVDVKGALVKLEAMKAWEVDLCVMALYVAIAVGFLYTTLFVSFDKSSWEYAVLDYCSKYAMLGINFLSFMLALFYNVRMVALPSLERTDEQFWTCVLLSSGLLGQSPFTEYFSIDDGAAGYQELNEKFKWAVFIDAVYAACTYFFLICSAHSYRVLGHWQVRRLRFYFPKFVLISFYVGCRLFFELWSRVHLGFVPLTRIIQATFFLRVGWMDARSVAAVIMVTTMDLFMIMWFFRELSKTRLVLANLNYMETRTKQLGYRFFLYQSVCFMVTIFLVDAFLVGCSSREDLEELHASLTFLEMTAVNGKLGLSIMYFTWLALTAYGNYPAGRIIEDDSELGQLSITRDADGSRSLVNVGSSFMYKHREWKDKDVALLNQAHWSNIFVMELQVLMMNCSWLAYIPMNKAEEKQAGDLEDEKSSNLDGLPKIDIYEMVAERGRGLRIVRHLYDEPNDGHCIILEDDDRVIVSFGGTRQGSMKNWRANFQFNQVKWSDWFHRLSISDFQNVADDETRSGNVPEGGLLSKVASEVTTFANIKVHAGFARMYKKLRAEMMSVLVSLYSRDKHASRRQLLFTGHSLGGAMSAMASYDCALNFRQIGLRSRRQIQVTTFGTPKVGNLAWRNSYDSKVPRHWRCVLASDVVTKMPQDWNYFHVGVKVLLDWSGVLLVDPSFVEVRWWHTVYTSTSLHTRASYYLALRAWCRRYKDRNGRPDDLADAFWPWPIRPQYTRLFVNVEATPGS